MMNCSRSKYSPWVRLETYWLVSLDMSCSHSAFFAGSEYSSRQLYFSVASSIARSTLLPM